jgi:anti-sigma factor RsiW
MIDVGRDLERMRDYVVGRMSDDERRAFEDRLVRDPELVREFEQSLRLREGLAQLQGQGYFTRAAAPARASRAWLPALATAAAIAGLAVILWVQPGAKPAPVLGASLGAVAAGGAAPSITAHFTFVATRGELAPDLALPSNGDIEFRAAPGARAPGSRYRVTLARENDSGSLVPVGVVEGLAPGPDGYVYSYAAAARLSPGRYQLRVDTESGQPGTGESFPFTLRAGTAGAAH